MLKTVLYWTLLISTALRFVDLIYLLALEQTTLPLIVFLITAACTVYGLALIIKKFISALPLRQLMLFFAVDALAVIFNLTFLSITYPLQISFAEAMLSGTFLHVLVDAAAVFACLGKIRKHFRLPAPALQTQFVGEQHGKG